MNMYLINLNTIKRVKAFVNEILCIESDAVIKSRNGKYVVDAKSIMGIFSLNLTEILILEIDGEENEFIDKIKNMDILVEELKETN